MTRAAPHSNAPQVRAIAKDSLISIAATWKKEGSLRVFIFLSFQFPDAGHDFPPFRGFSIVLALSQPPTLESRDLVSPNNARELALPPLDLNTGGEGHGAFPSFLFPFSTAVRGRD